MEDRQVIIEERWKMKEQKEDKLENRLRNKDFYLVRMKDD